MTGRNLSSSGSSLPAPKKQHRKDQSSNPSSGGNGRRHSQRRSSTNTTTKAKDGTPSFSKTSKNINKRKGSTTVKLDDVSPKESPFIGSDEEDTELIKIDTPPTFNTNIFHNEDTTFEMVKVLKIFNHKEYENEGKPPMKSMLRLAKKCLEPSKGVDSMHEFPSCCFGLAIEETEGDNYKTVQIIGLGLRLRELIN